MKAITVKQPWASLIVEGIKDIENRTWPTKYRGKVLIHAAASSWSWDKFSSYIERIDCENLELQKIVRENSFSKNWLNNLSKGVIIGSVDIVDCVINHSSVWAEKSEMFLKSDIAYKHTYNWVLANPIKFHEPIPAKGKLSFWEFEFDKII